jgi:hypothetical protein
MGALFNPPKAPAPPPPPPNPQVAAKANESITGASGPGAAAGGTILTGAAGAPETKTAGKALMGQ